ncbi:P-loop ATPase, Sll1717 family [Paracoccus solventivorans]|nr:hypothetical protein [Paracoccus solventivorans]
MNTKTAFFAYPQAFPLVRDAIRGASQALTSDSVSIKPWEEMNVLGFKLDNLVRENIDSADFLAGDITYPNHNVFYEMGYAMARGKPVLPTVNSAIKDAVESIRRLGIFDTTGYATYNNADELSRTLSSWEKSSWLNLQAVRRDFSQPLFILDTLKKTDFRNWIFHAISESELNFRSFDPAEVPRLTASQAITEVSASAGVVIPLISSDLVDADLHNLRAGFILGIAHGFNIDTLVIQYENGPAPLDYRDFVRNSTSRIETLRHVSEYCQETLVRNQRPQARHHGQKNSILNKIDLGSSSAENEASYLDQYFVETAEFSRALRAEGAIVTGRKGSGKSAIYLQVLESHRESGPKRCVVDLRPASHDLSEMREALLSVMSAGVFDHTVAAFWQYIIYFEIILKLREMALPKSKVNFELQKTLAGLEDKFSLSNQVVSGDFTSRLKSAVDKVILAAANSKNPETLRSELTNFMFESPIPALRDAIVELKQHFDSIHILIDDLDKGWPAKRVEEQDVLIVKHLIETLQKIRRELAKRDIELQHLLFLRRDIYERLVELTSDRGKYNVINVDWSDPLQLENLILTRVATSVEPDEEYHAWEALNAPMPGGGAIRRLIGSSLMRPRFLIDLCERTLSFAINRGHEVVEESDVDSAVEQMSLYLVSDFGYEIRDVAGTPDDIFYLFIGSPEKIKPSDLDTILSQLDIGIPQSEVVDLLLWYGFLGIIAANGSKVFIYDRAYDIRRLEAERRSRGNNLEFALNPAFLSGLR